MDKGLTFDAFCDESVYFPLNRRQRPFPQTSPPARGANLCLDKEQAYHTVYYLLDYWWLSWLFWMFTATTNNSFVSFQCHLHLYSGPSFLYILVSFAVSYTVHSRLYACTGSCFAFRLRSWYVTTVVTLFLSNSVLRLFFPLSIGRSLIWYSFVVLYTCYFKQLKITHSTIKKKSSKYLIRVAKYKNVIYFILFSLFLTLFPRSDHYKHW